MDDPPLETWLRGQGCDLHWLLVPRVWFLKKKNVEGKKKKLYSKTESLFRWGKKNYFPLGVFFKFLVLYLYCSLSLWQLINLAIYSFQTSLFSQFPDTWNYLPGIILCVESSPNIIKSPEICQMGQITCFKVKKQTNNLTQKQENYLCTLLSEHFGNFPYILFSLMSSCRVKKS